MGPPEVSSGNETSKEMKLGEVRIHMRRSSADYRQRERDLGYIKMALEYVWVKYRSDPASQCHLLTNMRGAVESGRFASECLDCLAFCRLFPEGYKIEGDELVQLWMAANLVQQEPKEFFAGAYLRAILVTGRISSTEQDCGSWEKLYKFNDTPPVCPTNKTEERFHQLSRDKPLNLDSLPTQIRTLLLLKGHKSSYIDRVPYEFFSQLCFIEALDLSGTKLSRLPSSIGSAASLRYLNLSKTLIERLPENICHLRSLQTLKLRSCLRLGALPKAIRRVTSLRHLDLGTQCGLYSMPPGIGALTGLYTLSNFTVGMDFGCGIGELKNLNNLTGRVCLSRLENVGSVHEAKEAQLQYKPNMTKLDLKWTDRIEWENVEGDDCQEEVIQQLRPPKELQDLEILGYRGSKFPTWISLPCFDRLTRITLFKCENCQLLPSLGQLPSLESLTLAELVLVRIIDSSFYIDATTFDEDNFVAFPTLRKLEIKAMLSLEEWKDMGEVCCFPELSKLVIKDCPQLTILCGLSNMCSLKDLEIKCCERLPSLPNGGLPDSLWTFIIDDCPLLSLSCNNSMKKEHWRKTEHSSSLLIYERSFAPYLFVKARRLFHHGIPRMNGT